MRLLKCCCCIPLRYGTIIFGCIFGLMDLYFGSMSLYYCYCSHVPATILVFFDKMDARKCLFWFAITFYLMSFSDVLLISGAVAQNPACMGPWLIVSFIVLMCTLATALLSAFAIIRIVILVYAMLVVNSYYDELTDA